MRAVFARAGDTFFTRSNTILGRLIRWGETDPGETNGTWTNHTGVVVESGWIGEPLPAGSTALAVLGPSQQAIVVEALWQTRRGPLKTSTVEVRVFRPIPGYAPGEIARFRSAAESYVGDKYGWWKLGVLLGDRLLFRGRKILSTALYRQDRPICSFLAAFVNQAAYSLTRATGRLRDIANCRTCPPPSVDSALLSGYAFGMMPQSADPDEMMDFCLAHPEWWLEVR